MATIKLNREGQKWGRMHRDWDSELSVECKTMQLLWRIVWLFLKN